MAGHPHLVELRWQGFRNLRPGSFSAGPAFNCLEGPNGAGKTSVVEAVHLLGHGRSFRTALADRLIQHGISGFSVYGELVTGQSARRRLGMSRTFDGGWTLRRDDQPVASLIEFVGTLPVVSMEPQSHLLLAGGGEYRRRYLDWLLFHVEPDFLVTWRRYMRALRQRNAALKLPRGHGLAQVKAWEPDLAESGEKVDRHRHSLLTQLQPLIVSVLQMLGEAIEVEGIRYRSGWSGTGGLAGALEEGRSTDMERGFTQRGPHRGDWRIQFHGGLGQEWLSRGQGKLVAIACLLAQAALHQRRTGVWPVLVFDDLASELDTVHQAHVLRWLRTTGAQVFITGTEFPAHWKALLPQDTFWFHVEQGEVARLL